MTGKFVHERGIWCTELVVAGKFVHERGILCAEFGQEGKFVHERCVWCAKWVAGTGIWTGNRTRGGIRSRIAGAAWDAAAKATKKGPQAVLKSILHFHKEKCISRN